MNWGKPENSIWLLFLPVFVALAIYAIRWQQRKRKDFADENLIPKLFPPLSSSRYWLKFSLITLGLLFAVIALLDPLFGEEKVKVKREGIDVVYALDLSNSMDAEDVAPSRLEKAKKIISESLSKLGGDRVGLIIFAADAYTISPLTNDYAAVQSYINSAGTELISQQGTSFSGVLRNAAEIFQNAPTTGKLLVVISDGEDNESSVQQAVKIGKENNINIVTLGVGTKAGGPIPVKIGDFEEYKMDRYGETVISKLNESSMQDLAHESKGIYIRVNQTKDAVNALHTYLNSLDKKAQDTADSLDKKHVFQWFLAISLLLIFIDTLTTEHKVFNKKMK